MFRRPAKQLAKQPVKRPAFRSFSLRGGAAMLGCAAMLLTVVEGAAWACSCMRPETGVLEQLRKGAIVAEGAPRLLSGQPAGEGIRYAPVRYELQVFKSIGARLPDTVIVETADSSAACGVNLSGRKTALLRLLPPGPSDEPGVYSVNLCAQLSVEAFEADWRAVLDAAAK